MTTPPPPPDDADDFPDDWWLTKHVSRYLGVQTGTVSGYVTRGHMPGPDRYFGHSRAWRPDTIRDWHATRRSQRTQDAAP